MLRVLIVTVVFVGGILGLAHAAGVEFFEFTTGELAFIVGMLCYPPLSLGLVIWRGYRADPAVRAALAGMGLKIRKWQSTGLVGGIPATVMAGAFQVPIEGAKLPPPVPGQPKRKGLSEHKDAWVITTTTNAELPLAVLTAQGAQTAEALELPQVSAAPLPARYRMNAAPTGAETQYRESPGARGVPWLTPEIATRVEAIGALLQVRTEGATVRVVITRPPAEAEGLRQSVLLARAIAAASSPRLAALPFDESGLPPVRVSSGSLGAGANVRGSGLTGIITAVSGLLVFIGTMMLLPSCNGHEAEVLKRLDECAIAREAIGEPVKRKQLGWQPSGSMNKEQSSHVLVKGEKTEGDISIKSWKKSKSTANEDQPLLEIVLETDSGERIDLLSCSTKWTSATQRTVMYWGVVESTEGAAPVQKGAACRIDNVPGDSIFPCKMHVQCGGTSLYGGTPTTGYTVCSYVTEPGPPALVAKDVDRRNPNNEPTLDFDPRRGTVLVGGTRGEWKLAIDLGSKPQ